MKRLLGLKALRPHLYGTRRLEAGDEYEAPAEEAIAQVATRKADFIKGKMRVADTSAPAEKPAPPPAPSAPRSDVAPEPDEIDQLRLKAEQRGIDVDRRWGVARLQYEISKVRR